VTARRAVLYAACGYCAAVGIVLGHLGRAALAAARLGSRETP
jgi:hypothetical protein